MNRILLTGGSGSLGTELLKLDGNIVAPTQKDLNIMKPIKYHDVDVVIHAAGFTDLKAAEKNSKKCYMLNVEGTRRMSDMYPVTPFVYISSEYAYNPVNNYGVTKLLAEELVAKRKGPWLTLRTLFKPRPFPYEEAFKDQFTYGDYVDTMAMVILERVKRWNKETSLLEVTSTGRKSMLELARRTVPGIKPCSVNDFYEYPIPKYPD